MIQSDRPRFPKQMPASEVDRVCLISGIMREQREWDAANETDHWDEVLDKLKREDRVAYGICIAFVVAVIVAAVSL